MKRANGLIIAALVILGLTAVYWLYQGIGLILREDPRSWPNLWYVPIVVLIIVFLISRKRTLIGGIITSSLGILLAVYFLMVKLNMFDALPFLVLMCVPMTISGLLFIEADWSSKKMM